MPNPALLAIAQRVLLAEALAIQTVSAQLDENFVRACELIKSCSGRVICIGMGKSGHVARKISATLSSVGSPSFFMHPGEGAHGDLGAIRQGDVCLILSQSGETAEVLHILPVLKQICLPVISMTGNANSTLAKATQVHIHCPVAQEATRIVAVPTCSTTCMLALGDALAIAIMEARGFTKADFARSHPSGPLGK